MIPRIGMLLMLGFALAFLPAGSPVRAQSIDDIVAKNKIVVGVINDLPPFGFVNKSGELDGYEAAVARLMAKHLGVVVELVAVSGPNRIPYLLSGKIDAVVATLAVTPARAKQVMYSIAYGDQEISLYASKSTKIDTPDDVRGLKIAVTRGNVEEQLVKTKLPSAQALLFDDDASTHQALLSHQADAVLTNAVTFRTLTKGAAADFERKLVLNRDIQGIAVRRGSFDLLQWINTFVAAAKLNGELDALHRQYFAAPLPPDLPTF